MFFLPFLAHKTLSSDIYFISGKWFYANNNLQWNNFYNNISARARHLSYFIHGSDSPHLVVLPNASHITTVFWTFFMRHHHFATCVIILKYIIKIFTMSLGFSCFNLIQHWFAYTAPCTHWSNNNDLPSVYARVYSSCVS